jgi:hypothetical protein
MKRRIVNEILGKDRPIDEIDEIIFNQVQREGLTDSGEILRYFKTLLPYYGIDESKSKLYYIVYQNNFRQDGDYSTISWSEFKGPKDWRERKIKSNRDADEYVESLTPFKANNLSGQWETDSNNNDLYVVLSYGYYPIYIYKNGKWYGNNNKYSSSTAKHMSYSRPKGVNIKFLNRQEMEDLRRSGTIESFIEKRKEEVLNRRDVLKSKYKNKSFKDYSTNTRISFTLDSILKKGNRILFVITVNDVFLADRNFKPTSDENYLLGEIPNVNKEYVENRIISFLTGELYHLYLEERKEGARRLTSTFDFKFKHKKEN